MSIIATFTTELGTKTWEVNSRKVNDFTDFSTSFEVEAEDNSSVEGSPLTNERGLKKQSLSFSSTLVAQLGVDVRAEIEDWKQWVGQTGILKIGGETFGPNYMLKSVKIGSVQIDTKGRFHMAKLTFSFEENDEEIDDSIVEAAEEANGQDAEETEVPSAVNVTCSTAEKAKRKAKNLAVKYDIRRLTY
ncbi:MAG TPA: hypothetical protein IAC67_03725 [Candidatus Coproplasma excrementipullorum]|nr:hypothetical protein [Candidatus Coproplasma excrementipullorum]